MDSYNGKLITMYADTYKPDPVTQAKIDEWDNKVKKITDEVVAHSPEVLTRSYGESAPTGSNHRCPDGYRSRRRRFLL